MTVIVLEFVFSIFAACAGVAAGWWLRDGKLKCRAKADCNDHAEHAREVLTRLHELTTTVAADVGEHSSRVREITDELSASDATDADVVVDAVARLVNSRGPPKPSRMP